MVIEATLPPHVRRMRDALEELANKLTALDAFTRDTNPLYANLSDTDRGLLLAQESAMGAYMVILTTRLNRATGAL